MIDRTILEKFRARIEKMLGPIDQRGNGCWEWKGRLDKDRYGQYSGHSHNKPFTQYGVHRLSFELYIGAIPDGMYVLHRCDNPPCINPDHLFIGFDQDNKDDMVSKKRHAIGEWNGSKKFPDWVIESVRVLRMDGLTQKEIGEIHGISQSHVHRIIHGILRSRPSSDYRGRQLNRKCNV